MEEGNKKTEPFVLDPPWRRLFGSYSACALSPPLPISVSRSLVGHASHTPSPAMPSLVALTHIYATKVLLRLPGQPRGLLPARNGGSLWLRRSWWLRSAPADLRRSGRRSQLCRGASPGPERRCPVRVNMSSSFSFSTSSPSSASSSSANDGQGKPKAKSPFRKRGSLQSCTSPGECELGGREGGRERVPLQDGVNCHCGGSLTVYECVG